VEHGVTLTGFCNIGMSQLPRTTLEQWAILRVVVEHHGFAQAAEHLNKSQSSVSYAVSRLQERLGVALLELDGRRAVLTETGRMLLSEAGPLIDELKRLEQRGRAIGAGHEARIRLRVDSLFSKPRLFAALQQLEQRFPLVRVELLETVRQSSPDPLLQPYDLAIAMPSAGSRYGRRLEEVEMLAVAHVSHPLNQRETPVSTAMLARHLRVDIQGMTQASQDEGRRVWLVTTLDAAVAAVLQGLCFGWLPHHLIAEPMADGRLRALRLTAGATRLVPLELTFADEEHAGPAVRMLARLLSGDAVEA